MDDLVKKEILTDDGQIRINSNDTVHNIHRATYKIMDELSKKGQSKGIFVMPNLDNFFYDFGIITALNYIIGQQNQVQFDIKKLREGFKYKFYEHVFINLGIVTEKNELKLKAQFKDETYYLPIAGIPPQLVVVEQSTPLTTLKKLLGSFMFNEQKKKNQDKNYDLADVLYKSLGNINASILIIASINKIRDYLKNTFIQGKSIYELIKIGQIDKNGNIVNQSNANVLGNYSLLICSNMDFVKNSVKEGHKFNKILIDFDNFREYIQNDILDYLHKQEIDMYIFKSFKDYKYDGFFEKNNYLKWNWSNEYLTQSMYKSKNQSYILNRIINNQKNRQFDTEIVDLGFLPESVKAIFTLNDEIENMNSIILNIYENMYEIARHYFRLSFFADADRLKKDRDILNSLEDKINSMRNFIEDKIILSLLSIQKNLFDFLESSTINNKMLKIEELVKGLERRIAIITNDKEDKDELNEYFSSKKYKHNMIYVYTTNEFFKDNKYDFEHIIITSWFGRDVMQKILFSNTSNNYILLLTGLELEWFTLRLEYLDFINNKDNNLQILEYLGYNIELPEKPVYLKPIIETEDVLCEFEYKLSNRHYSRYTDFKNSDEQEEAYPIRLSGGYIIFISKDWELGVITDIFNGQSDYIEMKNHTRLSVSDVILYHASNPDLIRSIADKDEKVVELRLIAGIWKKLISRFFELNSKKYTKISLQKALMNALKENGCKKHPATIKNWINNPNIIIPDDIEDIKIILRLFKKEEVKANEIYDAGLKVRQAHVQAGMYLSTKTNRSIKDLYEKNGISLGDLPYEEQDEEFGKLYYLRIDRIDSQRLINKKYIGRLLKDKEGENL